MARLADLAGAHPSLHKELPFFQMHHYTMGGLSLLQANDPVAAARNFAKAIRAYPYDANAYYLFLKSIAWSVMFHGGNRRRS
jgi:hypothetical protein